MRRALVGLLLILLCLSARSWGAIGIGASCVGFAVGTDTLSFPCSPGASGVDRAVICGLALNDNSLSINTFTYGTSGLTLVHSEDFTPPDHKTAIFGTLNQPTGAQTVTLTLSGAANMAVGCTSFTGVHQTVPNGTPGGNHSSGVQGRSVTLASTVGELVVDVIFACDENPSGLSPGLDQVQQWLFQDGFGRTLRSSTKAGASPNVTMSWTWSSFECGSIAAVPLKPAAVSATRRAGPMVFQ